MVESEQRLLQSSYHKDRHSTGLSLANKVVHSWVLAGLRVHSESAPVSFHASVLWTLEDQCLAGSESLLPQHAAVLHGSPHLLSLEPSLNSLTLLEILRLAF